MRCDFGKGADLPVLVIHLFQQINAITGMWQIHETRISQVHCVMRIVRSYRFNIENSVHYKYIGIHKNLPPNVVKQTETDSVKSGSSWAMDTTDNRGEKMRFDI